MDPERSDNDTRGLTKKMSAEVKEEKVSESERQSKELNDFVRSLPASTSDREELVPEEIDGSLPSDMPALPALPNPKVADDGDDDDDDDEEEDEEEDDNGEDEGDGSKESENKDKTAIKSDGDISDRKEGNEAVKDAVLSVDYNYYANQGSLDADPAQKPPLTTPAKRRASITDEKSFSEIMSEAEEAVSKTSMLPFHCTITYGKLNFVLLSQVAPELLQ